MLVEEEVDVAIAESGLRLFSIRHAYAQNGQTGSSRLPASFTPRDATSAAVRDASTCPASNQRDERYLDDQHNLRVPRSRCTVEALDRSRPLRAPWARVPPQRGDEAPAEARVSHGLDRHFRLPGRRATPIGIIELACVALYWVPRTRVLGAILLTGYLGGAIATHVRAGQAFANPLVIGIVVWAGLFLRDPRLHALLPLVDDSQTK